jgi:hypothetical protein
VIDAVYQTEWLSGNAAKARTLYARLVALCDHADDERPELRHAKAALAK